MARHIRKSDCCCMQAGMRPLPMGGGGGGGGGGMGMGMGRMGRARVGAVAAPSMALPMGGMGGSLLYLLTSCSLFV